MRPPSSPSTAPAKDSGGPTQRYGLSLEWSIPEERTLSLIGRDRVVIGRADDADWILNGDDTSRQHAELRRDGPLWVVHDLGSRNGTFVNAERVERAPIGEGTVLRIGGNVAVVAKQPEDDSSARPLLELAPGFFAGASVQRLLQAAERVAQSDLPLIVEGETGAGKERVARWVHLMSGRSGPFVAINCAALPEALAEAELFGYRKGAFTGSVQASQGHFRAAHGGTLLLDEVLDLSLPLQAKLLRAIEQGEVSPIGESTPVVVNVRILTASQAPLEESVRSGKFRGDLLARLDGLTLRLPPLRERSEDVGRLFLRFLSHHCGGKPPAVDARLLEALCLYSWPFNVRELELLSRRMAIAHGSEPLLKCSFLPSRISSDSGSTAPVSGGASPAVVDSDDEYDRFVQCLRANSGVVARAAEAAGVSRMRAYRLMKEHGLDLDSLRRGEKPA